MVVVNIYSTSTSCMLDFPFDGALLIRVATTDMNIIKIFKLSTIIRNTFYQNLPHNWKLLKNILEIFPVHIS